MSTIAERLSALDTKLNTILTNANTQLTNKGKTAVSDLSNLPSAVSELKNPTGSISITENGTVDVSNYASANVNVSGGTSEYNAKVVTTPISTAYTQYPNVTRFIKEFPAVDLTGFTTCQSFFMNCNYLEKIELFNTSNCTSFDNMFNGCYRLKTIPQFNTSKGTTFKNFCNSCENLEDVSILDTSKATPYSMSNMFQGCNSLTNESLNNILYMCAHVGSGSAYRNLAYIGLSSAQATTCTELSNWASAQSAGWTTGY
jgi:hypothetical protein